MGFSHEAALWIPRVGLNTSTVEQVLRGHEPIEALQFVLSERSRRQPQVTCVVTVDLHDHDELAHSIFDDDEEHFLDAPAIALARKLKTPTWVIYAQTGDPDYYRVKAFSAAGKLRWELESEDDVPEKTLRPLAKKLKLQLGDAYDELDGTTLPYWRMMAEQDPPIREDVIGLRTLPAIVLSANDGWTSKHTFAADGEAGVEAPAPRSTKKPEQSERPGVTQKPESVYRKLTEGELTRLAGQPLEGATGYARERVEGKLHGKGIKFTEVMVRLNPFLDLPDWDLKEDPAATAWRPSWWRRGKPENELLLPDGERALAGARVYGFRQESVGARDRLRWGCVATTSDERWLRFCVVEGGFLADYEELEGLEREFAAR